MLAMYYIAKSVGGAFVNFRKGDICENGRTGYIEHQGSGNYV